jgi:hypothetical protein
VLFASARPPSALKAASPIYRLVSRVDFGEFSTFEENSGRSPAAATCGHNSPKNKFQEPINEASAFEAGAVEGALCDAPSTDYQLHGFRNHHQRSVRESNFRSQWPSDHSSWTLRQLSGTCGYG